MYMWLNFPIVSLSVSHKPARKRQRDFISIWLPSRSTLCCHTWAAQYVTTIVSPPRSKHLPIRSYFLNKKKKKKLVIYWGGNRRLTKRSQESWAEGLSLRETEPRKTGTQTAVHKAQAPTTSNRRGWRSARRWFPAKKNSECRFPVLTAQQTTRPWWGTRAPFIFMPTTGLGFCCSHSVPGEETKR